MYEWPTANDEACRRSSTIRLQWHQREQLLFLMPPFATHDTADRKGAFSLDPDPRVVTPPVPLCWGNDHVSVSAGAEVDTRTGPLYIAWRSRRVCGLHVRSTYGFSLGETPRNYLTRRCSFALSYCRPLLLATATATTTATPDAADGCYCRRSGDGRWAGWVVLAIGGGHGLFKAPETTGGTTSQRDLSTMTR